MRRIVTLAVPYEKGFISEEFRKTNQFKIYEIENTQVVSTRIIDVENAATYISVCKSLHLEKVGLLLAAKVDESSYNLLTFLKIDVITGGLGNADKAVETLLKNKNGLIEDFINNKDDHPYRCDDVC